MNTEAKNLVDFRLAKGEISLAEHAELLRALRGQVAEAPKAEMLIDAPLFKLQLWSDGFVYDGTRYGYERITKLTWGSNKATVSLIPVGGAAYVEFTIRDGPDYFGYVKSGLFFTNRQEPLLIRIYQELVNRSFQARWKHYWEVFYREKKLTIGDAVLSLNGVITKDGVSIDLMEARQADGLHFGTVTRSGIPGMGPRIRTSNPHEVLLVLEAPKRRIVFTIPEDFDVLRGLLEYVSQERVPGS